MVGPQIEAFAEQHKLKRISVADLIAYRQAREKLVERVATFPVTTPIGELQGYGYRTPFDPVAHFAFVHGSIGDGRDMPARLHRCDIVSDIFGAGAIPKVLQRFKTEGRGALIYLREGSAGVPANLSGGRKRLISDGARATQWREIGLGAQILRDLGRHLDPAAHRQSARLRRSFGLRHRNLGGGADRRVRARAAPHPSISVATCAAAERARLSRS